MYVLSIKTSFSGFSGKICYKNKDLWVSSTCGFYKRLVQEYTIIQLQTRTLVVCICTLVLCSMLFGMCSTDYSMHTVALL